jgi:hypothetical protein
VNDRPSEEHESEASELSPLEACMQLSRFADDEIDAKARWMRIRCRA